MHKLKTRLENLFRLREQKKSTVPTLTKLGQASRNLTLKVLSIFPYSNRLDLPNLHRIDNEKYERSLEGSMFGNWPANCFILIRGSCARRKNRKLSQDSCEPRWETCSLASSVSADRKPILGEPRR